MLGGFSKVPEVLKRCQWVAGFVQENSLYVAGSRFRLGQLKIFGGAKYSSSEWSLLV